MTDLNNYDEIVQLSEDMEYPDGYNSVEVFGTGDTRQTRIWPTVTITGPDSMVSNGVDIATYRIDIYDPNSDNPFYVEGNTFEAASVTGPQDLSVDMWIERVHGVWADEAKTVRVPDEYLTFTENKIHIRDGWRAPEYGSPDDPWGLYYQAAWVEYDGYLTAAVEDGLQIVERWWVRPGDEESITERDVSGVLFSDPEGKVECTTSAVPVPNIKGQHATTYVYYRPDGGEAGIAYLNAAWEGMPALTTTIVIGGSAESNLNIRLSASPSSIGLLETADLEVAGTYDSGAPILAGTGQFYLYDGNGSIHVDVASFQKIAGEVETVYVSVNSASGLVTDFALSHPIVSIQSIVPVGGGWTWNRKAIISGNNVTLNGQEFSEEGIPVVITYTWGGRCHAQYKADNGAAIGDRVYCGFRFGGRNTICEIEITEGGSQSKATLAVEAADTTVAFGETTTIVVTGEERDGSAGTGVVNLTTVNGGRVTNATLGTKIFTDVDGSINSTKTFTLPYPPLSPQSITKVEFLSVLYNVDTVDGTTVTIVGTFPVSAGTCTVSYTAKGYGEATFTAPDDAVERICYVVGTWKDADPATAAINVNASGAGQAGSLNITAAESQVPRLGKTTLSIFATDAAGDPGTGTVQLTNINGHTPPSVTLGTKEFVNARGNISGFKTFSLDYPAAVGDISSITFLGVSYSAASVEGTEVTITGTFPTVVGEVTVTYTTSGYAECEFMGPDADIVCYVTALWAEADPAALAITVGEVPTEQLTLTVEPADLDFGQVSVIEATCFDSAGEPAQPTFSVMPAELGTFVQPHGNTGFLTEGSFTALMQVGTATITAKYTDPYTDEEFIVSEEIRIQHDGVYPREGAVTITATPTLTSIVAGESTEIVVVVKVNSSPQVGAIITGEVTDNGPGTVRAGMTDYEGAAELSFTTSTTDPPRKSHIVVEYNYAGVRYTAECDIYVSAQPEGPTTLKQLDIYGEVLPPNQVIGTGFTSEAVVKSFGVGAKADEWWCVEDPPFKNDQKGVPLIISVPVGQFVPAGSVLRTVAVSGEGAKWHIPDSCKDDKGRMDCRGLSSIDVEFPWVFERNTHLTHQIYVGDKADPSIPIVGATVTIGTQQETTDGFGIATFASLPEGEHEVLISHDNYTANYEDNDPTNDTYTVVKYSLRPWRLEQTNVEFKVVIATQEPYRKPAP